MTHARIFILDGTPLVRVHPSDAFGDSNTARSLELTAAIVKGDAAAFELLYRAWFPRMLGMARRATGRDESFALDVTQDAFVRVIRGPVVCATEAELGAWLRRCVLSASIDKLREEARRRARERARTRADSGEAPDLEAVERLRWLAKSLDELSLVDRDLLKLKFELDRTLEQIGALQQGKTGSWASVHGRIRRSLERLRLAAAEFFV